MGLRSRHSGHSRVKSQETHSRVAVESPRANMASSAFTLCQNISPHPLGLSWWPVFIDNEGKLGWNPRDFRVRQRLKYCFQLFSPGRAETLSEQRCSDVWTVRELDQIWSCSLTLVISTHEQCKVYLGRVERHFGKTKLEREGEFKVVQVKNSHMWNVSHRL